MREGQLYSQTNETQNRVIHYHRAPDGKLTEVERCPTGGSGSGGFNYRSTPLALVVEGVHGVILTPDRSLLFAVNGRDNSVSSFGVGENGKLTLLDAKRTGNIVTERGGTARSLAYAPSSRTLYVLHAFGPDHVRVMSVDREGMLTARQDRYSAVPSDKPGDGICSRTAGEESLITAVKSIASLRR